MKTKLTTDAFWDAEWHKVRLPSRLEADSHFYDCFNRLFNDCLPRGEKDIIEIGCAAGRFLIYFTEQFGYNPTGIEASRIGYEKTLENLTLADIQGTIIHGDFLKYPLQPGNWDIVFSAGLIEHFTDPFAILKRKCDLLKPGGLLITTIPNFYGIGGFYRKFMDKELYLKHKKISKAELLGMYKDLGLNNISVDYFCSLRFKLPSPEPHSFLKDKIYQLSTIVDKYVIAYIYQGLRIRIEGSSMSSYIFAHGIKQS